MSLATLTDLKNHLGLAAADTSQDAKLTTILAGVENWLDTIAAKNERALGLEENRLDYVDGTGSGRLFLPRRPVIQVREIRMERNLLQTFSDASIVEASSYRVYPDTGIVRRLVGHWHAGAQNIMVTYDVGYATVPAGLQTGFLLLCAYFATQASKEGLASERIGNYGYSLQTIQQIPGLSLILDPYISGLAAL